MIDGKLSAGDDQHVAMRRPSPGILDQSHGAPHAVDHEAELARVDFLLMSGVQILHRAREFPDLLAADFVVITEGEALADQRRIRDHSIDVRLLHCLFPAHDPEDFTCSPSWITSYV